MSQVDHDHSLACPHSQLLLAFLEEKIDPHEAERVDAHIDECPECQKRIEKHTEDTPEILAMLQTPITSPGHREEEPPEVPGYEIIEKIARGGMGVIWRARDLRLGREVALKVIRQDLSAADYASRFEREATVASRLTHPAIVPLHELGTLKDGRLFYTMKLVQGKTFASILKESPGADRLQEAMPVFAQICQAVAFAHQKGVLHRDLKPENVMVGEHGEVQVMDWGLTKVLQEGETAPEPSPQKDSDPFLEMQISSFSTTQPGSIMGSYPYLPPEQGPTQSGRIDRRSDVFGLGAILCEILTGAPPYRGTKEEVATRAIRADLDDAMARLSDPALDPELSALAKACLARDPYDRPQDAGEVAAQVVEHLCMAQKRAEQERMAREREKVQQCERQRRFRLRMAFTAAICLLLGVIGFTLASAHREQKKREQNIEQQLGRAQSRLALCYTLSSEEAERLLSEGEAILSESKATIHAHGSTEHQQKWKRLSQLLTFIKGLDVVRLMRATWTNGAYECSSAVEAYASTFKDWGVMPFDRPVSETVEQIQSSPAKARILAAVEDWAWVTHREMERAEGRPAEVKKYRSQRDRLLAIANKVSDEAAFAKLYDPKVWDEPWRLRSLAQGLNVKTVSPERLLLIGKFLPDLQSRKELWSRGLPYHKDDFWLTAEMGTLLMDQAAQEKPLRKALIQEALRFYQAASGLRPGTVGPLLDLAGALLHLERPEEALSYLDLAEDLDANNAEVLHLLGMAYQATGDMAKAEAYLTWAVDLDKDQIFPSFRLDLAELLQNQGRLADAVPHLNEVKAILKNCPGHCKILQPRLKELESARRN